MYRFVATMATAATMVFMACGVALATPQDDLQAMRDYFQNRYPDVALENYVNGPYPFDSVAREEWKTIMQFPPYTFVLDEGKKLFNTPFANGNSYADCFANGGVGIRQNFPYFDEEKGKVVTLAIAVNDCREKNGAEPLPYKTGKMAAILAYMAYTSRGNEIDIDIPDNEAALAAYRAGKKFFYARRGQLNFSCSSCHVQAAGQRVRTQTLAPAIGLVASFPLHRSKWGGMGTIVRRFNGCLRNIRANPLAPESEAYRNLTYFLMYMSNGLAVSGPASRP